MNKKQKRSVVMFICAFFATFVLMWGCGGGSAPVAPTNLAAVTGDTQNRLTWDAVENTTSYTLYFSNTAGITKDTPDKIADITDVTYDHDGLTNGTKYYYAVTASNGDGESDLSDEIQATPRIGTLQGILDTSFGDGKGYIPYAINKTDTRVHPTSLGVGSFLDGREMILLGDQSDKNTDVLVTPASQVMAVFESNGEPYDNSWLREDIETYHSWSDPVILIDQDYYGAYFSYVSCPTAGTGNCTLNFLGGNEAGETPFSVSYHSSNSNFTMPETKSMALDQQGKILSAGSIRTTADCGEFGDCETMLLIRILPVSKENPNGIIDTTFGTNGAVILDIPHGYNYIDIKGVTPYTDPTTKAEDILVVGNVNVSVGGDPEQFMPHMALWRFNENGELITGWGNKGVVIYPYTGKAISEGVAVDVTSSGRIYVGGYINSDYDNPFGVVPTIFAYTSAGALDTSFNKTGKVNPSSLGGNLTNMILDNDENILATGTSGTAATNVGVVVWKLLPSGALDTTFNFDGINTGGSAGWTLELGTLSNGELKSYMETTAVDEGQYLFIGPSGRLFVAGTSCLRASTPEDPGERSTCIAPETVIWCYK